jgi:hypothetical protein
VTSFVTAGGGVSAWGVGEGEGDTAVPRIWSSHLPARISAISRVFSLHAWW